VEAQVVKVSEATLRLQRIMLDADILQNLTAAATHELAFVAEVPPLGFTTFVLAPAGDGRGAAAQSLSRQWEAGVNLADNSTEPGDTVVLSNGALDLSVSTLTGRIQGLCNRRAHVAAFLTNEVGVLAQRLFVPWWRRGLVCAWEAFTAC
jgi:hypothetical protein